ncbi:carbon-nitrogen hydrolase family protein [Photobacterium sp. 1_MG-2023]|uniref:carbon-nitrogen hydrolase family protein n=1 Tax=Photobacterium sp. 1_MG-2023 TaxID=3062646 RepID=UPI0026E43D6E|nr:carbon-nitrogen hydrolase family protein [Photobacterium sp. 1_MG-2023]MDO6707351.1 carbon-nitrogen hydrolase family protein [Photobacterium sp. 1_MG-2023]
MKNKTKVAVVQDSSVPFDAEKTTEKAIALIAQCASNGAELAVFPEAFLGTYPKGLTFDAPIGTRLPEGREDYSRYYEGAVTLDGTEVQKLTDAAAEHHIFVVMGVIERLGTTLYCSVIFIDPAEGLVNIRRKLMPTGSERLIWGFGDGSTLKVVESSIGKIGAVICWENYMPALRAAMYAQGVEIYCAPTADDRESWLSSMRHIAMEGRCFVLSACQHITRGEYGEHYRSVLHADSNDVVMKGGSVVVGPLGEMIAGPVFDEKTIIYAELDKETLIRSKLDFDPVGHYARPDVLSINVDTTRKSAVCFHASSSLPHQSRY